MDNFSSFIVRDKSISDQQWQTFISHVEKIQNKLCGNFRIDETTVNIDDDDNETLTIHKDGSPVLHHNASHHHSFRITIAAMFMLYRQDCLTLEPKVNYCGTVMEAQGALELLREMGVWDESSPRCLVVHEDFEDDFRKAIKIAQDTFATAWNETDVPDKAHIMFRVKETVRQAMPAAYPVGKGLDWRDEVIGRSMIKLGTFYSCLETTSEDATTGITRWFRTAEDAVRFSSDKMNYSPLDRLNNPLFTPRDFEVGETSYKFTPISFNNLPHDRLIELSREISEIVAEGKMNGDLANMGKQLKSVLEVSGLSSDKKYEALACANIRQIKLELGPLAECGLDREINLTFPEETDRMKIAREVIDRLGLSYREEVEKRADYEACIWRMGQFPVQLPNRGTVSETICPCMDILEDIPDIDKYLEEYKDNSPSP